MCNIKFLLIQPRAKKLSDLIQVKLSIQGKKRDLFAPFRENIEAEHPLLGFNNIFKDRDLLL